MFINELDVIIILSSFVDICYLLKLKIKNYILLKLNFNLYLYFL